MRLIKLEQLYKALCGTRNICWWIIYYINIWFRVVVRNGALAQYIYIYVYSTLVQRPHSTPVSFLSIPRLMSFGAHLEAVAEAVGRRWVVIDELALGTCPWRLAEQERIQYDSFISIFRLWVTIECEAPAVEMLMFAILRETVVDGLRLLV